MILIDLLLLQFIYLAWNVLSGKESMFINDAKYQKGMK